MRRRSLLVVYRNPSFSLVLLHPLFVLARYHGVVQSPFSSLPTLPSGESHAPVSSVRLKEAMTPQRDDMD